MMKTVHEAMPPAPAIEILASEQRLRTKFAGARVLLAEDESIAQEVFCSLLEDVGLVVEIAENGQQSVELSRRNEYDLILMDLQMPELGGIEATKIIRADSLNQSTPIVAMTASAFDEVRQVCIDVGMNGHIVKPVHLDKLYETLLAWLPPSALE